MDDSMKSTIVSACGKFDGNALVKIIEALGVGDNLRFYSSGIEIPVEYVTDINKLREELSKASEHRRVFPIEVVNGYIQINWMVFRPTSDMNYTSIPASASRSSEAADSATSGTVPNPLIFFSSSSMTTEKPQPASDSSAGPSNTLQKFIQSQWKFLDGCVEKVKQGKININSRVRGQFTILHIASQFGYVQLVQWLVEKKDIDININAKEGDNIYSALHYATMHDRPGMDEVAKILITHPQTNIEARAKLFDEEGLTPLCLAALHNKPDIARLLQSRGASIEGSIFQSYGPPLTMIEYLFNRYDGKGEECLDALKILLSLGAKVPPDVLNTLVKKQNVQCLEIMIADGNVDLNIVINSNGDKPLPMALKIQERNRKEFEEAKQLLDSLDEDSEDFYETSDTVFFAQRAYDESSKFVALLQKALQNDHENSDQSMPTP